MDEERLCELIRAGETFTIEFKSDRPQRLGDQKLIEAAVCLANGRGGILLVGVEDDGRITGAQPRHDGSTDPFRLQALVSNRTLPALVVSAQIVSVASVEVIVIDVPDASTIIGTSHGQYVRRAIAADGRPQCVPYPAHDMLSTRIERGEVDYASIPEPSAIMADLDPAEFERFRKLARLSSATSEQLLSTMSDIEIARALRVATVDRDDVVLTRGAVLLFGHSGSIRRFVPTHESSFQVLSGQSVLVNEFTYDPLFKSAEALFGRVQSEDRQTEVDIGLTRVSISRLPSTVARELIANALVHRDYTRMGPVRVVINDATIDVTNPGGLPRGVTLNNLLDASSPRSPILSDAFMRAGLVERTGRGIKRVFEAVLRTGRDAPDYSRTNNDQVSVSVAIADSDLELVRFLLEDETRTGRQFNLSSLQVLHALRTDPRMSRSELAQLLQQSDPQTKATLARMVESGTLEVRGDGRARRYSLSAATYRALATSSAYVRVRPFDDIQQQQMVMTYIESAGRITRREVAELCGLTPAQAARLLRRMTSAGLLSLRGERRGSHYVRI